MSDVTVAAPSGGAPAAAPSAPANEVAINQNPTSSPNPVGSQAPDKPVGDFEGSKHRPESRRESIRAAFEKATRQQDEGAQRAPQARRETRQPERPAAEARPGHNNPPEETRREQQQQPRAEQHREGGRFARAPDAQAQQQPQAQQAQRVNPLPENAPFRDPPQRMDNAAKAEWHKAPESVRGAVHRMHQEYARGYQSFKNDVDAFNPVRRFHDLAKSQGTTLEKALNNYVSMEQKLRQDVVGGLDVIVRNLGLKGPDGEALGLRDVAYHILNMSPDQHRLVHQQNQQTAAAQQIGQLHQQIAGLQNQLQQMHNAQQFTQTRAGVDQFAEAHPRFDELGDLIENEIKLGFSLDQAYRRAELLRPATHAAQTRTASAQTRQANRSISGAPSGPSNGSAGSERKGPPPTRRDAIQRAIHRVQQGV